MSHRRIGLRSLRHNFARVHQTLRVTPAMEAGLADHVWSLDELVALMPEPVAAAWGTRNGRRAAGGSGEISK